MERLTVKGFNFTSDFIKRSIDSWSIAQAMTRLQEYEDLEESGMLVKLPCKVGDYCLFPDKFIARVTCVTFSQQGVAIVCTNAIRAYEESCKFFETYEQAKQALENTQNKDGEIK